MICDNCLKDCDKLNDVTKVGHTFELCDKCANWDVIREEIIPKRAPYDLYLVQCSPDMFEVGKYNVFFGEEQIGTLEDLTESKGVWIARPHGVVMGSGAYSKDSALEHLMKVRNASITKKQAVTLSSNQQSLF